VRTSALPLPHTAAFVALALAGGPVALAHGETLADALALAYQSNPTLISQRAQLEATNENYVQAEAGFRPTVSGQVTASYSKAPESSIFSTQETEYNQGYASATVTQPLYTGGRVTARVDTATAQIEAGREQLRGVEQQVLFSVIQAYADVVRDRAALVIQQQSYKELYDATQEIRARYEAGANTVTDRDQAETQLASSRALVSSAQAQVAVSVAEYVAAVGQSPGELASLPPLPGVPATVDAAFDACEQESPAIRQAAFNEAAARAGVQEAEAGFRPQVNLTGSWGSLGPIAPYVARDYMKDVSASVTLTQPIFTGGLLGSQVRQAKALDTSARVQVEVARRSAIQTVAQAWAQRAAALANVGSEAATTRAAQATFDGMRVEYRAGLRITLDVLTAQETLRDAEIALADAQHDQVVTEAALLQAVGRFDLGELVEGQPLLRPEVAFRRVQGKGAVPWQEVPKLLDRIGAPGQPQPAPLPEPGTAAGPLRIAPATASAAPTGVPAGAP
jgi:outer membrane protein